MELRENNLLAKNLMKMQNKFPIEYNFFPDTWVLPAEALDFKSQFPVGKAKKKTDAFILKPEASCQGRGIFIINSLNNFQLKDNYIAQRYIQNPYLIDGLKFDLRIYVLITGVDPLRIFIYKDGLARFATHKYRKPSKRNIKDMFCHLTNYAINKNSKKFTFNKCAEDEDKGHKRSYQSILEHFRKQGENFTKLETDIDDIIIKTICCVQPTLAHAYKLSKNIEFKIG